ncbi:MAG: methyltransferase domain-containing protein [Methanomicrobiaceae archaeon]|nr:methyltransferase domain-containing protein [Methanomicrobiaceae archaeon]
MQDHYDEVARVYDQKYNERHGKEYYRHLSDAVIRRLPEGAFLLDVGCGTGLFMHRYLAQGGGTVGLDISRGMLLRARDRCPGAEVAHGTAEVLPFADGTFDAVASLLTFSYLQHPERFLAESYRVLKPGGTISVCTLGRNLFTSLVPLIYTVGEHLGAGRPGMANFGEHYYNEDEVESLFSGAGFAEIKVRRHSFAHLDAGEILFRITKEVEPFIEKRIPYLAYNICAAARKPLD